MSFQFTNARLNTRTGQWVPKSIVGEQHTIELHEFNGQHGVILDEVPYYDEDNPIYIIEAESGGEEFDEVPHANAPNPLEFNVDYANRDGDSGTAFIEFHEDDLGKAILVSYQGLGTTLKGRYIADQQVIYPASLGIEGSAQIYENLIVGGISGGGDANILGLLSAAEDPLLGGDVGNRDYNDARYLLPRKGLNPDPDFTLGYWPVENGWAEVDDSANGGSVNTRVFDASAASSGAIHLNPGGNTTYIPVTGESSSIWVGALMRENGSFAGAIQLSIGQFDEDKVSLGVITENFGPSVLNTSYTPYVLPLTLDDTAKYITLRLSAATGSAGSAYVSYLDYAFNPAAFDIGIHGLRKFFELKVGSDIVMSHGLASGFGNDLPIYYASGAFGFTRTAANYDIDYTDSIPYKVKAVRGVFQISSNGAANDDMAFRYFDKDGNSTDIRFFDLGSNFPVIGGEATVPVYDNGGSGNKARIRIMAATDNAITATNFKPTGFVL